MKSGNWKSTTQFLNMRYDFSVCSFKQNLFVIGGNYNYKRLLSSCLKYDVKLNKWSNIANMNENRTELACTVFDGKIVISGGSKLVEIEYFEDLKSVEAYDYLENMWTFFT